MIQRNTNYSIKIKHDYLINHTNMGYLGALPRGNSLKSLTQNEKRFFKIYASRHTIASKNNYVRLFNSIDKLKEYKELTTEKENKLSSAIYVEKNYLYNLILECLDIYHKDSSIDRQISKYINVASVLAAKKLDEQSAKILDKAKKISEEYNRFENIVSITLLQKNNGFNYDTITNKELNSYYTDIFSTLQQQDLKLKLNKTFDELLLQRRRIGPIKNEEELIELKAQYLETNFRVASNVNTFDGKIYLLLAKIEYYRILRDDINCRIYCLEFLSLFDLHVNRITDQIDAYIYVLNVFIVERLYHNNRGEADGVLKKLLSLPTLTLGKTNINNIMIKVKIFEVYYTCITDIAIKFRDYEYALQYIPNIENELEKMENQMTPSFNLVLKSNIACIYFGIMDYKKSLKWCNKILNDPPEYRQDIFYTVKILYLIIHFELGNQVILPSIIKSTYRHLIKRKRIYLFENIFLKYLRLFLHSETKKEQKNLFLKFKQELLPLLDNKFENLAFHDIDIIGWIDKKLEN